MIMNSKLIRIWKEAAMTCLKALCWQLERLRKIIYIFSQDGQ